MKRILSSALFCLWLSACSALETQYSVGQIKTPMGNILIWLHEETPEHRASFIKLAQSGYWNDYSFNRVIAGFVAQGGCPDTPEGFAYSVHLLEPEFHPKLRHVYGAFAAGRDDNPRKLSAACQFYIVQNKAGLARLDDNYTVYGQVFKGMEVIDAIVNVKTDTSDAPLEAILLDVKVIQMSAQDIKAHDFDIPTDLH